MLAIICFSISYIFNFVLFNALLIQTYTRELFASICVIQAFIILFQKRLVIRIHPASIHYFYNTDVFLKAVKVEMFQKIISKALMAFLISLIISGLQMKIRTVWLWLQLLIFFIEGSLITWLKYKRQNMASLVGIYIISSIAFVFSLEHKICISVLCLLVIILLLWSREIGLNGIGEYYNKAIFEERIDCAGRYANMAEMQQVTAEQKATKHYGIKFDILLRKQKNALLWKVITELYRCSMGVKLLLAMLLITAVFINKTDIVTHIFLVNSQMIEKLMGIICYTLTLSTLRGTITVQTNKFLVKHRIGFFVPYSEKKIVNTYGKVASVIGAALAFTICVAMGTSVCVIFPSVIVTVIIFRISFLLLSKDVNEKIIAYVFNSIVFVLSFLIFE